MKRAKNYPKELYKLLKKYEEEQIKEEYLYRRTGSSESISGTEGSTLQRIRNIIERESISSETLPHQYNKELHLWGDQLLLKEIREYEKSFREIRKKISKAEYVKMLNYLVKMRNRFAASLGYTNYLEYQYEVDGMDRKLRDICFRKLTIPSLMEQENFRKQFGELRLKPEFEVSNQLELVHLCSELTGLDLINDKISLISSGLPEFYLGACIPYHIPDDIRVLVNMQGSLGGFAMLMHELGHGVYYSNIDNKKDETRTPYNLFLEEAVALFFENMVFGKEFLGAVFDKEIKLINYKINSALQYQKGCIEFEEYIYNNPDADYDKLWKSLQHKNPFLEKDWTSPHFFVSAPGYFSSYFLGGCVAKPLFEKTEEIGLKDTCQILKEDICAWGSALDYKTSLEALQLEN